MSQLPYSLHNSQHCVISCTLIVCCVSNIKNNSHIFHAFHSFVWKTSTEFPSPSSRNSSKYKIQSKQEEIVFCTICWESSHILTHNELSGMTLNAAVAALHKRNARGMTWRLNYRYIKSLNKRISYLLLSFNPIQSLSFSLSQNIFHSLQVRPFLHIRSFL